MFPNDGANRTFAKPHDTCQSIMYGRLCLENSQENDKKSTNTGQKHSNLFQARANNAIGADDIGTLGSRDNVPNEFANRFIL